MGDDVDWWRTLFGTSFDEALLVRPSDLVAVAKTKLQGIYFGLIHFCAVDNAGHALGVGEAYMRAARDVDEASMTLAREWGWPNANVVIVSDHGHRPKGGHGGEEADIRSTRLIVSGPAARKGGLTLGARARDVAPTLAALLGVSAPAQSQGRTLTELLDVRPSTEHALRASDDARSVRLAEPLRRGRDAAALQDRTGRLARGVGGLLFVTAIVLFSARHRRAIAWGTLIGAMHLSMMVLAYWITFGSLSFGAARLSNVMARDVAVMSAALAVVIAWVSYRRAHGSSHREFLIGTVFASLSSGALAIASLVCAGILSNRFAFTPAWVAAAPFVMYVDAFPPAACALVVWIGHVAKRRGAAPT